MKLVVVGSHKLSDTQTEAAKLLLSVVVKAYSADYPWDLEVGSGGADGVDRLVDRACTYDGIPFREFPPKHQRWEPEGFKDRNLAMARWCDILISIRGRDNTTYGSGWTADRAEEMGKDVFRFYV